jgi:SAM-dependent methyltransferase
VSAGDQRAGPPPFADHFTPVADRYAACRPAQPPEVIAYAASLAPRRGVAWDCGTGSGQAALGLAASFERVVATDASAAQIARAAPHPRVEYRVAPAEACGLPDASVDLVAVAQALHWFDLEPFYREVRRVAAPGAAVVVWSYLWASLEDAAPDALLQELARETLAPDWPREIRIVAEGYRTIPFPFREVTPPAFVFTASWTLAQLLGFARTWSATARHVRRTGRDPVAEAEPRLLAVWGDPFERRLVRWPIAIRAGHCP